MTPRCPGSVTTDEGTTTMTIKKMGAGRTTPKETAWRVYDIGGSKGLVLDVDTSAAGFDTTPLYFTSLGGNVGHWATTGATSIYSPTKKGFRVYVRWVNGNALTPEYANLHHWHINWYGIQL